MPGRVIITIDSLSQTNQSTNRCSIAPRCNYGNQPIKMKPRVLQGSSSQDRAVIVRVLRGII